MSEPSEGDALAEVYDAWYGQLDPTACVTVLAELAPNEGALELGAGTGRVAIPLADQGLHVHGVDNSRAMIEALREKAAHRSIETSVGDLTRLSLPRRFGLVYAVFNTICSLTTQADQSACFRVAAQHLARDGVFVTETYVPDVEMIRSDRPSLRAADVQSDGVSLTLATSSVSTQQIESQTILLSGGGFRLYPRTVRWVWPSELDLMAQLAGLRLVHRWSDWERRPFGDSSADAVSVYALA